MRIRFSAGFIFHICKITGDCIFQYKKTCKVLLDYPKIGRENIKNSTKSIGDILHSNIDVHSRRLIAKFLVDVIKCIEKLQSHCAKKNRYDRIFQQITHEEGKYAMKYIKRFQNTQDLSVWVGNNYSEDQLIHTFLYNFHQGRGSHPKYVKCSYSILSYQFFLTIWNYS